MIFHVQAQAQLQKFLLGTRTKRHTPPLRLEELGPIGVYNVNAFLVNKGYCYQTCHDIQKCPCIFLSLTYFPGVKEATPAHAVA